MTRRIGRRPGDPPTRQQIVDAARVMFAARGFRGATTRAIADAAGVDQALIHHYFGTKEQLFTATLQFPEGVRRRVLAALEGPVDGLGERLTRAYLELWEDPETRNQMMITMRAVIGSDDALSQARNGVVDMLGKATSSDVPGPDPEMRFALAMAHLVGVAAVRHLSKVPPLCDLPLEELIVRTAPAIELHLTGC